MELVTQAQIKDPHSNHVAGKYLVKHIHFELDVSFNKKIIFGKATYTIDTEGSPGELILDIKDIKIKQITGPNNIKLKYKIKSTSTLWGDALVISMPEGLTNFVIEYHTLPRAAALQWLTPSQTSGKKYPFLYTQGQAILARSWFPCPDGPAFRFTYSAEVTADAPLQAVMSARRVRADHSDEKSGRHQFRFEMNKPVPAYLVALAVGDLKFQPLDERCGLFAEPEVIQAATDEFSQIPKMLETAEQLYGPYRWERFDVLVLPPSFPFGGMENPMVTFATPTILAGDRSLTNLIAHELAHSWSGNLVTNATWNDFWLNEGFTVYFERRIMEALEGKEFAEMLRVIGYQDVQSTIQSLKEKPEDTHLKLSLQNRNPDEGVTEIAYEKGYFFLLTIESLVGRKAFDAFLNQYFNEFAFKTIATETFLQYLKENLFQNQDVLWEHLRAATWIYGPGLPSNCPIPKSKRFDQVSESVNAFMTSGKMPISDARNWSTYEWLYFLRAIQEHVDGKLMLQLDQTFQLTKSKNSEILFEWLLMGIVHHYEGIRKRLSEFLIHTGRRKFVAPLYKAMLADNYWSKEAQSIYKKARSNYHSVTYRTIDELMGKTTNKKKSNAVLTN